MEESSDLFSPDAHSSQFFLLSLLLLLPPARSPINPLLTPPKLMNNSDCSSLSLKEEEGRGSSLYGSMDEVSKWHLPALSSPSSLPKRQRRREGDNASFPSLSFAPNSSHSLSLPPPLPASNPNLNLSPRKR